MHDVNKFERQNRARLAEIYLSVRCPETTGLNWCGALEGQPCRKMGALGGTLAAQTPREPHQSRKLLAIDRFLAAAGVAVPPAHPDAPEPVPASVDVFTGEPAPWEKR